MTVPKTIAWAQFSLTAVLLTASFGFNAFRSADASFFAFIQWGPEGLVIGRLLIAEEEGLFSHGALLGECSSNPPTSQHSIYLHHKDVTGFEPYKSQVGLQGQVAAAFYVASPFERDTTLRVLHFVTALGTALALSVLLVWLWRNFGHLAWAAALVATLFSPWVTVLAQNLYWASWAFYLPLCAVAALTWTDGDKRSPSAFRIAMLVFAAVLVKCLFNGYEFMTTTLLMMMTPLVVVGVRDRWSIGKLGQWSAAISMGTTLAVAVTVVLVCLQVSLVEGSFSDGVDHLLRAFERRSRGEFGDYPPGFQTALRASTLEVLKTYASGTAIGFQSPFDGMSPQHLPTAGRITYGDLLLTFALFSGLALGLAWWLRRRGEVAGRLLALVAGTWFASLAPLSWFVIFKAHAYIHTNVDFIVWHMPFVPVAFALCGYVVEVAGSTLWHQVQGRRQSA